MFITPDESTTSTAGVHLTAQFGANIAEMVGAQCTVHTCIRIFRVRSKRQEGFGGNEKDKGDRFEGRLFDLELGLDLHRLGRPDGWPVYVHVQSTVHTRNLRLGIVTAPTAWE